MIRVLCDAAGHRPSVCGTLVDRDGTITVMVLAADVSDPATGGNARSRGGRRAAHWRDHNERGSENFRRGRCVIDCPSCELNTTRRQKWMRQLYDGLTAAGVDEVHLSALVAMP